MRGTIKTYSLPSARRVGVFLLLVIFILTNGIGPVSFARAQEVFQLPQPGTRVSLSPAFAPALLKGIKVYPDDPFRLDFILDQGNANGSSDKLKEESSRLIKYFLASITVPEKDLWVNLSPYEKDRIVPDAFGQTGMGRDLLAQDYLLKQITSSVIYPEGEVGKKFWAKVYAEAQRRYGTTDIPVDTFNKVWIVPEKAIVYENKNAAYVVGSRLKVMLETDYVAATRADTRSAPTAQEAGKLCVGEVLVSSRNDVAKNILREVVIPILEKEVNEGQNFARLRQVYNSLILAVWFKDKIKESIFGKAYVDREKIAGVEISDKAEKEKIWARYVESFKEGAYNFIREEKDTVSGEMISRKYFSGGNDFSQCRKVETVYSAKTYPGRLLGGVPAMASVIQVKLDVAVKKNLLKAQRSRPSNDRREKKNEDKSEKSEKASILSDASQMVGIESTKTAGKWLKSGVFALAVSMALAGGGSYYWLRWGYDVQMNKMLALPQIRPAVGFQDGKIVNYDGHAFKLSSRLAHQQGDIHRALAQGAAGRDFWTATFANYPADQPVSALLTVDVLQSAQESGQLDGLFNGLRTQPDLVYRYLSEIPYQQMQGFSYYFSKLKPGIRQKIFQIFYRQLADDFEVLENGKMVKSVFFSTRLEQAERMRRLYGEMMRALNYIPPLKEGDMPEGPLTTAPDSPVAPFEGVAFTRQQAADEVYQYFSESIDQYKKKGYTVTTWSPEKVNIGDVEGMIGHYSTGHGLGKQSYYMDNKAGLLLQWVQMNTTSKSNAHRITQKELIVEAMHLAEDPRTKTVDLFNAIATISHMFKSLTRSPHAVLGAYLAMGEQDGVDYIWDHFQPNILVNSLYQSRVRSVDDQGRPVFFWRPVDLEGNDSIPSGQRTGIMRADTGHDLYHGWGVLLMNIYLRLESINKIKADLYGQRSAGTEGVLGRVGRAHKGGVFRFKSADTEYLPLFLKIAQSLGVEEYALDISRFSKKSGSGPEVIFSRVAAKMAEDVVSRKILTNPHASPGISTLASFSNDQSFLRSLQGGIDLDRYAVMLNKRWAEIRREPSSRAMEERARLVETTEQLLTLEKISGKSAGISDDLRKYVFSSVAKNALSENELAIQLDIFEKSYLRTGVDIGNINAPFIFDVLLKYDFGPENPIDGVKHKIAGQGRLLLETYMKLAKDPDVSIKYPLIRNVHLPSAVLVELLSDENLDVVLAALEKLRFVPGHANIPAKSHFPIDKIMTILSKNVALETRLNMFSIFQKGYPDVKEDTWNNFSMMAFGKNITNDSRDNVSHQDRSMIRDPGGIDLTRDKMNVAVTGGRNSVKFKFDAAMIQRLNDAAGITPTIIDIHPMAMTLASFLGEQ